MADPKDGGRAPRWREDFPIQWDDDHYVSRRDLAKFLTLGSGVLVLANAAVFVAGRRRHERAHPPKRIAAASALVPGASLLFRFPTEDDPCLLVRTKAGELAAFSQVCTHLSCAVVYRAGGAPSGPRAGEHLFCPCHNGVFACRAGEGGADPVAGPPERPLPRITLEVRGDDVWAVGVEA